MGDGMKREFGEDHSFRKNNSIKYWAMLRVEWTKERPLFKEVNASTDQAFS